MHLTRLATLAVLACAAAAPARAITVPGPSTTVNDPYWGKGPAVYTGGAPVDYSSRYANRDVIGDPAEFDVKSLTWSITGSLLNVTIHTNYGAGGTTAPTTKPGDLFIATGGWAPCGSAANHYACDNLATTGTVWNYAIQTSSGKLFALGTGGIVTSDAAFGAPNPNNWIYRTDQPVAVNACDPRDTHCTRATQVGGFSSASSGPGAFTYAVDLGALGSPSSFGLSWTMSCANDVIQTGITVPEPATLGLLGLALAGVGVVRRRQGPKAA